MRVNIHLRRLKTSNNHQWKRIELTRLPLSKAPVNNAKYLVTNGRKKLHSNTWLTIGLSAGAVISLAVTVVAVWSTSSVPHRLASLVARFEPVAAVQDSIQSVTAAAYVPDSPAPQVLGVSTAANPIQDFQQQVASLVQSLANALSRALTSLTSVPVNPSVSNRTTGQPAAATSPADTSQLSAQLSDTLSSIQSLQNQVASLPLQTTEVETTSVNLIQNSSFEANSSGQPLYWAYLGQSTSANTFVNNASVRSGNSALRIQPGGGATRYGIYQPSIVTLANHVYTLSLFIRNASGQNPLLELSFWDHNNNRKAISKQYTLTNSSNWVRYSFTLDPPKQNVDGNGFFPMIEVLGASFGNVYIDDVQLSEGSGNSTFHRQGISIGDGSVVVDASANIYPSIMRSGSLGSANYPFNSLNLTAASIDQNGNTSLGGNLTISGSGSFGGNLSVAGSTTISGNLTVSGTTNISGGTSFTSDLIPSAANTYNLGSSSIPWKSLYLGSAATIGGNLAINGGSLTTTATTFNLFNSTATTVNLGGAATSLSIGASSGTTTINNNLAVTGTSAFSSTLTLSGTSSSSGSALCLSGSNQIVICASGSSISGSGVSGQLSFWTGTSTLSGNASLIWDNTNTRLGIGTSAPSQLFSVGTGGTSNFTVNATGNVVAAGTLSVTGATTLSSTLSVTGLLTASGGLTVPSGQNLTLSGLTSGSVLFAGASGVLSQNNSQLFWDNTNNRLGIGTASPSQLFSVGASNQLTVNTSGNLATSGTIATTGTGTITSASTLTASNGLSLTTGALNLTATSGTEAFTLSSSTTAFNVNGLLDIDTSNSRIGIGTTTPAAQLDVEGSTVIKGPIPHVDVRAYGAKGDGSTDDTTAIQNAINDAKSANAPLYFPSGNYKITTSLDLTGGPRGWEIYGDGKRASIIAGNLSSPYPVMDFTGSQQVYLHDIGITGNSSGSQSAGVLFARANGTLLGDEPTVQNVYIEVSNTSAKTALANISADLMTVIDPDFYGPRAISISVTDILSVTSAYKTFASTTGNTLHKIMGGALVSTLSTGTECIRYDAGSSITIDSTFCSITGAGTSFINLTGSGGKEVYMTNSRMEVAGTAANTYVLNATAGSNGGVIQGNFQSIGGPYINIPTGQNIGQYVLQLTVTNTTLNLIGGGGNIRNSTIYNLQGVPASFGSSSWNNQINQQGGSDWVMPSNSNANIYMRQTQTELTAPLNLIDTQTSGVNFQLRNGILGAGYFDLYDQTNSASRLVIDSSGHIGIGTASPSSLFSVGSSSQLQVSSTGFLGINVAPSTTQNLYVSSGNVNDTSGSTFSTVRGQMVFVPSSSSTDPIYNVYSDTAINPVGAANASGVIYGINSDTRTGGSGTGTISNLRGGNFSAYNNTSGANTITNLYGVASRYGMASTGSVGTAYGVWSNPFNSGSGTLTTNYDFYGTAPNNSGTITSSYGMRIENQGRTGVTNAYGLYINAQSGATTTNYAAIFAGGNVGIGLVNPSSILSVKGSAAAGNADILYQNTGGTTLLQVDNPTNAGTAVSTATSAVLYVGSDNITGRSINAVGTINASGADVAEYFHQDIPGSLYPGYLVCIAGDQTSQTVTRCQNGSGKTIVGVVSTHPGFVGNDSVFDPKSPQKSAVVALTGQVPVQVSTANGPISVGDPLTVSSIPGVAIKATHAGEVVGTAMEAFDGTGGTRCGSGSKCGEIVVVVNVGFADPNGLLGSLTLDSSGNLMAKDTGTSSTSVADAQVTPTSEATSSATSIAVAGSSVTGSALSELQNDIASLSARLSHLETKLAPVSTDASASASVILALTPPEQLLASSSAVLAADLAPASQASISGTLNVNQAVVSETLKSLGNSILGNTIIAGSLAVDGTLAISGNSLSAIGTLHLQNGPLAQGLDLLNGAVMIDKGGNITTIGTVSASKAVVAPDLVGNKLHLTSSPIASSSAVVGASLGKGTILMGKTTVEVNTAGVNGSSEIFVTATSPTGGEALVVTDQKPGQGFTVGVDHPYDAEMKFNWWIVDTK